MNTKIVNKIHVQLLVYITFLLNTFSYNLLNFHRNISHKWNSGLHNTYGMQEINVIPSGLLKYIYRQDNIHKLKYSVKFLYVSLYEHLLFSFQLSINYVKTQLLKFNSMERTTKPISYSTQLSIIIDTRRIFKTKNPLPENCCQKKYRFFTVQRFRFYASKKINNQWPFKGKQPTSREYGNFIKLDRNQHSLDMSHYGIRECIYFFTVMATILPDVK